MNSGAASLNRILGQPITGWSLRQLPYRLRDLFSFFAKQGYEVIHTHRMAVQSTDSGVRLPWFKSHLCYLLAGQLGPSYLTFM